MNINTHKNYGWFSLIVGIIFIITFFTIGCMGIRWLFNSDSSFQTINAFLTFVIGLLGTFDGVRTMRKGYKLITLYK